MIILNGKNIDEWGRIIYDSGSLFQKLYEGKSIDGCLVNETDETKQYNRLIKEFDTNLKKLEPAAAPEISAEDFHSILQNDWFIPDEYKNMNLEKFLLNKCTTQIEIERIQKELKMFEERDMMKVLKFLIYLVEIMKKNKIVYGIGRGSSVSSYALFLIGIHRVNSIKYNLDIEEFLR